jgi:hypothetical protein
MGAKNKGARRRRSHPCRVATHCPQHMGGMLLVGFMAPRSLVRGGIADREDFIPRRSFLHRSLWIAMSIKIAASNGDACQHIVTCQDTVVTDPPLIARRFLPTIHRPFRNRLITKDRFKFPRGHARIGT